MTHGLMDTLLPCEPLGLNLGEPRVVSFDDSESDKVYKALSKAEQAKLLEHRVKKVKDALRRSPNDFVPYSTVCRRTGMNTIVVCRIMCYLFSHGKVERVMVKDRYNWRIVKE